MTKSMETGEDSLRQAVTEAARRAEVRAAVGEVYAALQSEIDVRRPRCDASGRCCRFEEYGHRLYVTTAELAAFVYDVGRLPAASDQLSAVRSSRSLTVVNDAAGCPFQVDRLCGVHAIRPFGCRVFFCDPTAAQWQNEAYERFHGELKQVHEQLDVPYFYVEWRRALAALGLTRGG
jgi:Fe-S-cluster containining protein